jgi:hypothetical protein
MESTEAGRTSDWRMRTTAIGGALGAVTGVVAAWLFIKSSRAQGKSRVKPDALLEVGIGVLGLLKQFAKLSEE